MSADGLNVWACDKCAATLFAPKRHAGRVFRGGVCTQQRKGCVGELYRIDPAMEQVVRQRADRDGHQIQPWLTLVPSQRDLDRATQQVAELEAHPRWVEIMEHATAWTRGRYRNHFCSGPDCDNWPDLQAMRDAGLLTEDKRNADLHGGMSTFHVTALGLGVLEAKFGKREEVVS